MKPPYSCHLLPSQRMAAPRGLVGASAQLPVPNAQAVLASPTQSALAGKHTPALREHIANAVRTRNPKPSKGPAPDSPLLRMGRGRQILRLPLVADLDKYKGCWPLASLQIALCYHYRPGAEAVRSHSSRLGPR